MKKNKISILLIILFFGFAIRQIIIYNEWATSIFLIFLGISVAMSKDNKDI